MPLSSSSASSIPPKAPRPFSVTDWFLRVGNQLLQILSYYIIGMTHDRGNVESACEGRSHMSEGCVRELTGEPSFASYVAHF